MTLLARPTADELDPWIRYTGWNEVLGQSKHGIVQTHTFTREPDPDEPKLVRLLEAWKCILKRCLDTLAATDHKDTLKWWASPKNEAASQFPFELHQNAQSVDKCSAVWQQFICYAMRTAPEEQGGETETGVKYTASQWRIIKRMRERLSQPRPELEEPGSANASANASASASEL